jgi:hypothetical protein
MTSSEHQAFKGFISSKQLKAFDEVVDFFFLQKRHQFV